MRKIHPAASDMMTCFREPAFWFLLLAGVLYFYPLVFLGETLYFRDLFSIFLTQKRLLVEFISSGQLPLWDPYVQGGRPYFANPLNSLWYPTNLLYLILPFFRAFNLIIVGHFLGYLAAAYILARTLGLQPVSSTVAAIVYGFCGYSLSLINLLNMFLAMLYLPVLLICWHQFLRKAQVRWFIAAVVSGVIQVCAGSPEVTLLTLLLVLGWSFCSFRYPLSLQRRSVLWGVLVISIIGAAAIQILPLVEMLAFSSRRYGLSYHAFSKWSLLPARLPELFLPQFFGSIGALQWQKPYWGHLLLPEGIPLILSLYLSPLTLMLAVVAGFHHRQQFGLPRRFRRFLFIVFAGSLMVSCGKYLPGFQRLYHDIPLFSVFRFPIKFLSLGILPCALLAGAAFDVHFGQPHLHMSTVTAQTPSQLPWKPSVKLLWFLGGIAVLFGGATVLFLRPHKISEGILSWYFGSVTPEMAGGILRAWKHSTLVWGVLLLVYMARRLRPTWWQGWIVAAILLVDLGSVGHHINRYAPETLFTDTPEVVPFVHDHLAEGRVFRTQPSGQHFALDHLPDEMIWRYRWSLETLANSFAAYFKIPVIFHEDFDRLGQAYVLHLKTLLQAQRWERRFPILSAAGVSLIITPEDLEGADLIRIGEIPNWSGIPFYIYRNTMTLSPVSFVASGKTVANNADALGCLLHPNYDPRTLVILQPPDSTFAFLSTPKHLTEGLVPLAINFDLAQKTATLLPDSAKAANCRSTIEILSHTPNATHLRSSSTCDGYLVFTTPYYVGWQVTIDGESIPVLRANYAFSAVPVSAGIHEIRHSYRPLSLLLGSGISLLSWGVLGLGVWKRWLNPLLQR